MKNILVLGYFGYINNQIDGQTIKTRSIYKLLKSKEAETGTVKYFDTQELKRSKFRAVRMIGEIIRSNKIIYLPAYGNLKYLFPVIYSICAIKGTGIYYMVVGGWLSDYLKSKRLHVSLLKRIKGIYTETELLKKSLEKQYGFRNVVKFPNFRIHNFRPQFRENNNGFRLVFMARITRLKGLDTLFRFAEYAEKNLQGSRPVSIDFYGPVAEDEKEYFEEKLKEHPVTSYKGTIEPDEIYQTLQHYDVMALPTQYYTEGFPGSVLDAYISGIPVIVTNWKHASEFVVNNVTGFIVPFENGENEFIEAVLKLYSEKGLLDWMKHQAYEKSEEYSSEHAWNLIKGSLI
ncbi:MAG: glycosyltransferase family 4 protein [Mangrovibacterium sp.]